MEDAPAQDFEEAESLAEKCLNPCFNGRCTRTL